MTKIPEKICLFCKRFCFSTGEPDYSEWTPGHEASILCLKGHWQVDLFEDDTETYRQKLLTALNCEDWEQVEL